MASALNRWWLPFLSLIAAPLLAAALAFVLFPTKRNDLEIGLRTLPPATLGQPSGDEYYRLTAALLAVLIPGLLYLVPWLWLRSGTPRVRAAAKVTSTLGLLGLGCLLAAVLSYGWTSVPEGAIYLEDDGPNGWLGDDGIIAPQGTIWLMSILTSVVALLLLPTFWLVTRPSRGDVTPP